MNTPTHQETIETKGLAGAVAFVGELSDAFFQAAAKHGGPVDRYFRIGSQTVCLRFAGPALLSLFTASLEHLATTADPCPHLTVGLWDTASTGIQPPVFPWKEENPLGGEVCYCLSDRIKMALPITEAALNVLDAETGTGFYWVRDPNQVAVYEIAEPIRLILGWWASQINGQLAHGGAVGTSDGGVLLAGPGGSGKSTTALACLLHGMLYAGDDYVLLRDEGELAVYSLYNTAKLDPGHLNDSLPSLAGHVIDGLVSSLGKSILHVNRSHSEQMAERMQLRAIIVPTVSPKGRISVKRMSAIEVFKALAPTSAFHFPGAGPDALRILGQFVQRAPGFRLEVGPDFNQLADTICQLLAQEG